MSRWMRQMFQLAVASLLAFPGIIEAGPGHSVVHRIKQSDQPPTAASGQLRTATDRKTDIRDIRLELKVDVAKKTVVSQATIQVQGIRPTKTLNLDAMGFDVKKVEFSREGSAAQPVPFKHDGKKLAVELGNGLKTGENGTLTIDYLVQSPRSGLHFYGPTKTNPEIPLQVWSQGQTITNRYWIPCLDEPNQRQTSRIIVTVPKGFEAISNGKLVSRKENADGTVTFDWHQDKTHSSYLMTLVVGEFDMVEEQWNGIPVMYYVPKGRKAEAIPTYGKTPAMMTYFSSRFGIPYPWDKYAQVSCYQFGGGMENTSATTMGDGILLDQRALLDSDSDWIVSHELAHQWWGDLVTCRDWSHTWLNEGFASYAEALWDEHSKGKDAYDMNMNQKLGSALASGKTRPIMDRRYPMPDSMFDGRSYPKAAWVLHMLRNRLGDDAFFKAIQQYGTQFKFQTVETGDFRRSVERSTNRDLERFFYDWLERPGNPDLDVTTTYDADTKKLNIAVKQTQASEAYHLPVKINLYCAGVNEPVVIEEEMREKELKLTRELPGALDRMEVDPEHALLATFKETKSRELWKSQLLNGSTSPLRVRALQYFRNGKTDADREVLIEAFQKEKFHGVKAMLAGALGDLQSDVARDALMKGLSDADAKIRSACVNSLIRYKKDDKVVEAVRNILQKGDPSYAVETACLRAYGLMGQKDALSLLTPFLGKPGHQNNLTLSAIRGLSDLNDPTAFDSLLPWCESGRPRSCRNAAIRAVQPLIKSKKLTEAQQELAMKTFVKILESDDQTIHFSVLESLPQLGASAKQAIPALEKLLKANPDGNLKDSTRKCIDALNKESTSEPVEKK